MINSCNPKRDLHSFENTCCSRGTKSAFKSSLLSILHPTFLKIWLPKTRLIYRTRTAIAIRNTRRPERNTHKFKPLLFVLSSIDLLQLIRILRIINNSINYTHIQLIKIRYTSFDFQTFHCESERPADK